MVLFFLLFSYAYFSPATQWNENSRFNLTRSLVERGSLNIDPYHQNTGDKSYREGHYYTDKAPGVSFLGVPGYALIFALRKVTKQELPQQMVVPECEKSRYADFFPSAGPGSRSARTDGSSGVSKGGDKKNAFPRMKFNSAYRRGLYMANLFGNGLIAAVAGMCLFLLLFSYRPNDPVAALFGTAAYSLGTIIWPYSTLYYGHGVAASLLIIVFYLNERWTKAQRQLNPPTSNGIVSTKSSLSSKVFAHSKSKETPCKNSVLLDLGLGFMLALITATDYPSAVAAALLGLYIVWTRPHKSLKIRTFFTLAAGALPIGAALGLYHHICFGSPFSLGYEHLATQHFAEGMSEGLYGVTSPRLKVILQILVGPHRGLLYISPVLILAIPGAGALKRSGQTPMLLLALIIFTYFLILNASYYMWDGGAAFGPRHALPGLALMAFVTAAAYPSGNGKKALFVKFGCWFLVALSAFNMLTATAVGPETPLNIGDPLQEYLWPNFFSGQLALTMGSTNFGLMMGLKGLTSVLPLFVFWALAGCTIFSLLYEEKVDASLEKAG